MNLHRVWNHDVAPFHRWRPYNRARPISWPASAAASASRIEASQQSHLARTERGERTAVDVELRKDARDVVLHRAFCDVERDRDLFVRRAAPELAEHFDLARRQSGFACRR